MRENTMGAHVCQRNCPCALFTNGHFNFKYCGLIPEMVTLWFYRATALLILEESEQDNISGARTGKDLTKRGVDTAFNRLPSPSSYCFFLYLLLSNVMYSRTWPFYPNPHTGERGGEEGVKK